MSTNEQNSANGSVSARNSSTCTTDNETSYEYNGIYIAYEIDNDMLRFETLEDFDNTVKNLEKEYESYNDTRDAQFPSGYTTEEMDNQDSADNFDEFYPVKQFESNFTGFVSRRSLIETTESTWLDNDMTGVDPDEIDHLFDDEENALYNQQYLVKIGCAIYEMREDGLHNVTEEGGRQSPLKSTKGSATARTFSEGCFSNKRTSDFENINSNGNEKVKKKVAIHSFFVRSSAKGKVVYFKKKRNKFKRARVPMAAGCAGNIYNGTCTLELQGDKRNPVTGYKKRRQVKAVYRWWELATHSRQTKHHELAGTFELSNGNFTGFILIE